MIAYQEHPGSSTLAKGRVKEGLDYKGPSTDHEHFCMWFLKSLSQSKVFPEKFHKVQIQKSNIIKSHLKKVGGGDAIGTGEEASSCSESFSSSCVLESVADHYKREYSLLPLTLFW